MKNKFTSFENNYVHRITVAAYFDTGRSFIHFGYSVMVQITF